MLNLLKRFSIIIAKQYTSIGGQAVIEGVMMRSPNAFVVAVRTPEGKIRLRRDQWFGLSQKLNFLKKPFFRGVLILIETMANGVVSLNYSANIAMDEEMKEKALKKGQTVEEYEAGKKDKEKVGIATFLTIASSFVFGMGLFVFLPHAITAGISKYFELNWSLDSFSFHFIDGLIKGFIFISYIWIIGFIPDIRRVFQYHGAEHKSISTFEAGEDLIVENARSHSTLHPRCGTSFMFFLLFISIILFSAIFALVPIGSGPAELIAFITNNTPDFISSDRVITVVKHLKAIVFKMSLMLPVAGVSYEIIKFAGKHSNNLACKALSVPGMMLQKLTTKEPDDEQLEVALASIKAVLFLEEKYNLKDANKRILTLEEVDIEALKDIESTNTTLTDFME
jgi:uncharacterized protein YqhQ